MEETISKNDAFTLGRWREWLREIKMSELQEKEVTATQLKSIRVSISKLVDEELYFKTRTYRSGKQEKLLIQRIGVEEWLEQPKRRIM